MKLSKKITLFFIAAILVSIVIVGLFSNRIINRRFDTYLVDEQRKKLDQISNEINELYRENDYSLYEQQISSYASLENLSIKVTDLDGEIIYSSDHMMRMGNMHRQMMRRHSISEGEYVEKSFPLMGKVAQVGNLIIGYIDNSYLTENALIFKSTMTRLLISSAVLATFIGIIASVFLARSLTRPLLDIRNTAQEMQRGNLHRRSDLKTNTIEIQELSNSVNYLGETLSKQEEIRNKYASDISHELRTPISTLKSHIEAIMDGVWQASPEHLSILLEEINRLSGLVEDLRVSFNSQERNLDLDKSRFNISQEINDILDSYQPIFTKEEISLKKNIEAPLDIYMDRDKLRQIIYNLLTNSLKALDSPGEISIGLENLGGEVLISIEDNGIGIREEDLPQIFHRFYRVDESRNTATGGTGLGLSIVKSLVEAHEGTVSIESKYGEFTRFLIRLPRHMEK